MVINRDGFGNHQASIIITDFPGQKTPEDAALKLADWLKRLGESLRLISKSQRWIMPNPFDAVMFVLLVIGALQGMGWLPW
jgi:hypothetical protein